MDAALRGERNSRPGTRRSGGAEPGRVPGPAGTRLRLEGGTMPAKPGGRGAAEEVRECAKMSAANRRL